MNWLIVFAAGVGMMSVIFCFAWLWAVKIENYSLVDAVWAFGVGALGFFWLFFGVGQPKHWLATAMLLIWSLRLGWHLQRRIRYHYPNEDTRYVKLREVWQGRVARSFFWFFQAQAMSCILLALPFLFIARDQNQTFSWYEWIGIVSFVIGICGESLADAQMANFKKTNHDPKSVCNSGLWYYSRHPNYFFEAIIWFSFFIYACGSDFGWTTIHAPVMIIYLLLRVTGIPPTEAAAVLRKGDAYRHYQATTSAFIPWLPKSNPRKSI